MDNFKAKVKLHTASLEVKKVSHKLKKFMTTSQNGSTHQQIVIENQNDKVGLNTLELNEVDIFVEENEFKL